MINGKIFVSPGTITYEKDEETPQIKEDKPFDWEEFERTSRPGLTKNPKIKTKKNETVFSHETYAQDTYYMYTENLDDKCFILPQVGDTIEAEVVSIDKGTAFLDINYREYIYLELRKEDKRYLENIQPGKRVMVRILNDKDSKNAIYASYSDAVQAAKEREIRESIGNNLVAFKSTVKELINGGFIIDIDGISCFMPGSQVTVNKIDNFEDYIGKELIVMPVNYSPEKGTIVVSARAYLRTLIPSAIEYVKNNPKEKHEGIVTGTTKFGVFCEFKDCLTGLIHVSDLDKANFKLHQARKIKPNDKIEFYVKDITKDNKIILTQTPENNPWDDIEERYKVQSNVIGTVISVKEYGAFVELEKGVSGLIHFSEYEGIDLNEGDKLNVKITKINKASKKINFTKI